MWTQEELDAPRMTDDEIARQLSLLNAHRPHIAAKANEALSTEFRRLQDAVVMAHHTQPDSKPRLLAQLRAFAAATGNKRWIRSVERKYAQ